MADSSESSIELASWLNEGFLNSAVFGINADSSMTADASEELLGID